MKLRDLLPIGAALAFSAGAVAIAVRSRSGGGGLGLGKSGGLGKTARWGPRTGRIELDQSQVRQIASDMVDNFDHCGPDRLRPVGSAWVTTRVRDAATGDEIPVSVKLTPDAETQSIQGYLQTTYRGGDRYHRQVHILTNATLCATDLRWKDMVREVLSHELTHAADPTLIKRLQRHVARGTNPEHISSKTHKCGYWNDTAEVAAFLTETHQELIESWDRSSHVRKLHRLGLIKTPADLLKHSDVWRRAKDCLTLKNRRRFLKVAAQVWDELELGGGELGAVAVPRPTHDELDDIRERKPFFTSLTKQMNAAACQAVKDGKGWPTWAPRKVYLSDVMEGLGTTVPKLANKLAGMNSLGLIELQRADMPAAMDAAKLDRSELRVDDSSYHFMIVDPDAC